MVEYEYAECTTSAITALSIFRKQYPHYRSADIEYVNVIFLKFSYSLLQETQYEELLSFYIKFKSPKVAGMALGASRLPTRQCLRLKVLL
jgi:hypothetical protein